MTCQLFNKQLPLRPQVYARFGVLPEVWGEAGNGLDERQRERESLYHVPLLGWRPLLNSANH